MAPKSSLILVEESVLPKTAAKVLYAKQLLARGEAKTVSQAINMAGISRGAFYKYKDSVFAYRDDSDGRLITLSVVLADLPGVLSGILSMVSELGGNVVTVNQNIPVDSVAHMSLSLRLPRELSTLSLLEQVEKSEGVVSLKLISEE